MLCGNLIMAKMPQLNLSNSIGLESLILIPPNSWELYIMAGGDHGKNGCSGKRNYRHYQGR